MLSLALCLVPASVPAAEGRAERAATPAKRKPHTLRFNRDIRPILSDKCFQRHGPDAHQRKGKLRLDSVAAATSPASSGSPAIVPGKVDESELYDR
ncbi:MAG: c-type cytochrome domain-containing protein, partial [Isosphaeraceae bacterium]